MEEDSTIQRGTVLSAGGEWLTVRVERDGEECAGCRACPLSTLCKGRETGRMELLVPAPEEGSGKYAPGDAVRIEYTGASPALAAMVLFVPAMAGLALGGWLGSGFGDAALLAGCALGFAAGVGTSGLLARKSAALKPRTRLITEE